MTGLEQRGQIRLGDVCVLGLGKTGEAAASWLADHQGEEVTSVTLYGGARSQEGPATRALEERGVRVVTGTEEVRGSYDLTVASPGIPPHAPFFRAALEASRELIGEPELAWRVSPDRWVGITGTNGKTTTTTLTAHLLRAGGCEAECVGNIGTVAISRVDERVAGSWFVAELSSFQLETAHRLAPRTACLLNITPDHVSWHGSLEAYAQAKERIFQTFGPGELAVVSEEDDWCRGIIARLEARGVPVCHVNVHEVPDADNAAFVRDGMLVVRRLGEERLRFPLDELPIKGEHNAQNALAAAAMVLELGVLPQDVMSGLATFTALEHRIEPCGSSGGVSFVNDSKATNTDAVEKALTAFERGHIIVLLGGRDKGTDLGSLAREVSDRCRVAVCFGEAGERIAAALEAVQGADAGLSVLRAAHLSDALDVACAEALPGETVLLSPACASFDEFTSFEERGRIFKQMVAERIARMEGQS